ncbi:MAG: hypothetical protein QY332_15275 [Anaerolineales bacterium]|nr:MAG: hypothetical protein QY332_15275 [Anaerolineales bacterium]
MTDVVIAGIRQTEVGEHWDIGLRDLAYAAAIILLMTALAGCTPKPTEPIHTDSFFSGQALFDANGNGEIDAEDTPVRDATFIVELQDGTEFGSQTSDTGNAFVTIPSTVEYPVTVRMETPKGSLLTVIEPPTITLSETTGETIKFLFSSK